MDILTRFVFNGICFLMNILRDVLMGFVSLHSAVIYKLIDIRHDGIIPTKSDFNNFGY